MFVKEGIINNPAVGVVLVGKFGANNRSYIGHMHMET